MDDRAKIRIRTASGERGEWRDVRPLETLKPLMKEALEKVDAIKRPHEIEAGRLFLEAFPQVGTSHWKTWLWKEFEMTPQEADRLMKLASQEQKEESKGGPKE
jgi:hypothetical protein